MVEFERPTPRQRLDEIMAVAKQIGDNSPASVIFYPNGDSKSSIGIDFPFPQDLEIPDSQDGIIRLDQKSKKPRPKTQHPVNRMKPNQVRHAENLSGFSGWHKGSYYVNGQPAEHNTNGGRKNGNGRH